MGDDHIGVDCSFPEHCLFFIFVGKLVCTFVFEHYEDCRCFVNEK